MPNHCANRLTITGPLEVREKFLTTIKGRYPEWIPGLIQEEELICWHSISPVPEAVIKKGYDKGGYNWCVNNWGTRGSYCGDVEKSEETHTILFFQTPWTPPNLHTFELLVAQEPSLTYLLRYAECGAGYYGFYRYEDGDFTSEHHKFTEADILNPHTQQCEDEGGCDCTYTLREGLVDYQDLYNASG